MKKPSERNSAPKSPRTRGAHKELVREMRGGEPYEYYPLGEYIVAAPGVCGGRPTFKYTRIRVEFVLDLIADGWTLEQVAHKYRASQLSVDAVKEAILLARKAFVSTSPAPRMAA